MTHWINPWDNAIPVPVEELAEVLAGGTVFGSDNKPVPYDKEYLLNYWGSFGDKLDAYLLENTMSPHGLSSGIRYGNRGDRYLSPYIRDIEKARILLEKYRK